MQGLSPFTFCNGAFSAGPGGSHLQETHLLRRAYPEPITENFIISVLVWI